MTMVSTLIFMNSDNFYWFSDENIKIAKILQQKLSIESKEVIKE